MRNRVLLLLVFVSGILLSCVNNEFKPDGKWEKAESSVNYVVTDSSDDRLFGYGISVFPSGILITLDFDNRLPIKKEDLSLTSFNFRFYKNNTSTYYAERTSVFKCDGYYESDDENKQYYGFSFADLSGDGKETTQWIIEELKKGSNLVVTLPIKNEDKLKEYKFYVGSEGFSMH